MTNGIKWRVKLISELNESYTLMRQYCGDEKSYCDNKPAKAPYQLQSPTESWEQAWFIVYWRVTHIYKSSTNKAKIHPIPNVISEVFIPIAPSLNTALPTF